MSLKRLFSALLVLALAAPVTRRAFAQSPKDSPDITRATLKNGLRVVLIRNRLAPVVTVEANFMVGGDETPIGFPGTAHALEHMAFRGCTGMTADQTAAIYAQLGGENNADTQQNITQYYATIPAADLDIALEAQAKCLSGVDNTAAEWDKERGAIEQEVSRDLSNPTYKFIAHLNESMFAGTPYAHDPLGTRPSFEKTTADDLQKFYKTWYVPSNAILIVVGDFDPTAALAKIKSLYEAIPSGHIPEHPAINLQPVKPETFTLDSNLPYVLGFISYRMPGTDSPDFAAANILADVLASQRADIYAMVPAGKALAAEFAMEETYPKASVAFGLVAQPSGVDTQPALNELKKILDGYAQNGVPAELVDAAKRAELAQAEFQRNSIPGLANVWSSALAAEGRNSPDDDLDAIRKVTVADVNRVAKEYLFNAPVIIATLQPKPTGEEASAKGFGGAESVTAAPTKPVVLPDWAAAKLDELKVPSTPLDVSDTTLANGIRLIVRTDRTSPTVTIAGGVKHNPDLQTPAGKDGVDGILGELYSYGTTSLDRIAFQKALDDIAANVGAGYHFSLTVEKEHFARGVELLAQDELHPALPPQAFAVVQQQTAEFIAGNLQSPGYKFDHALQRALLPLGDPQLREATPATIKAVTLDDVKAMHATTIRPDLTTIVVIGDVTPSEAKATIEKYFGDWKATGPKPETDLGPVPVNKPSATNIADAQQVQDTVVLAEQLPLTRFSPDYYPLQLGTHVLGGGFYATRLYHDLRQQAGLVYSVDVALSAGKTRSAYEVEYGSDPDKVSKARNLVERDLKQMATEEVSPSELHQAKALLLRQIPLGESSEESVANGLLARAQIGLPLDEPVRSAKIYAGLTAAQIKAAFAKYVDTGVLVQVVRGPAPQ